MIKNVKGSEDFDSTSFIIFLYKWRKPLVIITLAAMIISIVVSSPLFITPKFKSTVILYPVSTSSISKALLSENASEKTGCYAVW